MSIRAHFIEDDDDKIISIKDITIVPRVDDELRFQEEVCYRVYLIVFVYDEGIERVNIGCTLIKEGE